MAPIYWIAKAVKYIGQVSAFVVLIVALVKYIGEKMVGEVQGNLERNVEHMRERMERI